MSRLSRGKKTSARFSNSFRTVANAFWKQRLTRACLLISMGFFIMLVVSSISAHLALTPCNEGLFCPDGSRRASTPPPTDLSSVWDMGEEDVADYVMELFRDTAGGEAVLEGLPDSFEAECFSVDKLECERVYSLDSVVGIVCKGPPDQVQDEIGSLLKERGWLPVQGADQGFSRTYVKEGGLYRWMNVVCYDVAGSTSVSMVLSHADSGMHERKGFPLPFA